MSLNLFIVNFGYFLARINRSSIRPNICAGVFKQCISYHQYQYTVTLLAWSLIIAGEGNVKRAGFPKVAELKTSHILKVISSNTHAFVDK